MSKTPVRPETNFPKQNIPYRKINNPFRFGFIIPGNGIIIEQDSNGVLYVSSESGMDVADIVAGDNIEITRTEDGKIVVSAVNTVADIAAGQNVSIDIDPETGTAIINSVVDGDTNEHYQGVFDNTEALMAYDNEPAEGDYGLVKNVTYSDGGADTWKGQYKYCFFIGGVWTVVDQMLTFTDDVELIKQFYSVGGSSPAIYIHKVAMTGDFNDLRNVPIVATPEVSVEGTTVTATCATDGAEIFYTTDGSMPHVNGTRYTGPVTVAQATTFRFVAIKNGMINSLEAVANTDYELQAPTISLNHQTGEISMENPNVDGNNVPVGAIYYTTDGSTPTVQSNLYTESFIITDETNFMAIVINSDDNHESPVTIKKYYKLVLGGRLTGGNNITGTAVYNINSYSYTPTQQIIGEVHYTDNGETPTVDSPILQRLSVPYYGGLKIIKTRSFADGFVPSDIDSWPLGADKPVSPPINFDADTNMVSLVDSSFVSNGISYGRISGLYCEVVLYPVSSSYPGNIRARIYYTTDGSTPDENSTVYTGPFPVANGQIVKAIVIAYGQYYSDVATKEISVLRMPSETFNSDTGELTLIEQNTGGVIYYTTDGSTPTTESTQYISPIILTQETVVKCISVVDNVGQSKVAIYGYEQATPPVITRSNIDLSTGNYEIVISADSKWKKIHYTLDGSTPTYQSPVFSNAIKKNIFEGQVTVKAIVIYSEQVPSAVVAVTYGESAVSAPEIIVDDETNKVTIELAGNTAEIPLQTNNNVPDMGARIYYTLDGSTPTAESSLYTGNPFTLPEGVTTIKAITVCYGEFNSDVTTEEVGPAPVTSDYMYFEAAEANSAISLVSTMQTAPDLAYSTNGKTWVNWHHRTANNTHIFDTLILAAVGDRVYFSGKNNNLSDVYNNQLTGLTRFRVTGKLRCGGNITSLFNNTGEDSDIGCAAELFSIPDGGNAYLLSPPRLNMTGFTSIISLRKLFKGQSLLSEAAEMPYITFEDVFPQIDYAEAELTPLFSMYEQTQVRLVSEDYNSIPSMPSFALDRYVYFEVVLMDTLASDMNAENTALYMGANINYAYVEGRGVTPNGGFIINGGFNAGLISKISLREEGDTVDFIAYPDDIFVVQKWQRANPIWSSPANIDIPRSETNVISYFLPVDEEHKVYKANIKPVFVEE